MRQHTIELRVRYKETDQMGVVYYSNYFVWFEAARTEFFRARGVEYRKLEEEDKIYLPVVEAYCRYKAPLKYDDLVSVTVNLADIGNMRITFDYEVKKHDKVTALGKTKHAFIDSQGTPIPIPPKIYKVFSEGRVVSCSEGQKPRCCMYHVADKADISRTYEVLTTLLHYRIW